MANSADSDQFDPVINSLRSSFYLTFTAIMVFIEYLNWYNVLPFTECLRNQ